MVHRGLLLLLLLFVLPAAAQPRLRVCMTDTPHAPWRLPMASGQSEPSGLDYRLLDQFERLSGWRVDLRLMAARRCLLELRDGRFDSTIGLSHNPERAAYLRYPMQGEQPDAALALRADSYSLYHRPATAVRWDGQKLVLPPGTVVDVQAGHSIAGNLRDMGVSVRERTRFGPELFKWLAQGEAVAVALATTEAEALRREVPQWQALVRVQPVIAAKPYFVVFARDFAQKNEAALPGLWAAFQKASQFPAYQAAVREGARHR